MTERMNPLVCSPSISMFKAFRTQECAPERLSEPVPFPEKIGTAHHQRQRQTWRGQFLYLLANHPRVLYVSIRPIRRHSVNMITDKGPEIATHSNRIRIDIFQLHVILRYMQRSRDSRPIDFDAHRAHGIQEY